MNPPNGSADSRQSRQPLSEAAKASLVLTHNLFRIFMLVVLGSFFVFQLDIGYLWLTALLTAVGLVLGIMLLIRAVKYKESRLVLFGTIAGMLVSAVMVLVILVSAVFFNQFRDYQHCARSALTQQGASECRTQLEKSVPAQLR